MIRLLVGLLLLTMMCLPVQAAKRVALVVGNSAYEHVPKLVNPKNDAEAVAAALDRLDFEVIKGIDLTQPGFVNKVREFSKAIRGADIALFYYAGHGLQVNGRNYLAPIETRLLDEADLDFEAVRLQMVLSQMEREPRTNLVILDACRNNPLARNLASSMGTRSATVGRGLAPIETGIGTLIAFATQPGNVALDGEGINSPFTSALVKHLDTPGEDIAVTLRRVRQDVITQTGGKQVPWSNSSLTGTVILKQKLKELPESDFSLEVAYWEAIQDGTDKRLFEAYLARFPEGLFAENAQAKVNAIQRRESEQKAAQEKLTEEARKGAEITSDSIAEIEQFSQKNSSASEAFDPSRLAKIDLNAAGSALPKRAAELTPEETERGLNLQPDDYQRIQVTLNALGYEVGAEDGAFGPKSRTGLRKYQLRSRVEESGYLNENTLNALLETVENTPSDYNGDWELSFHRFNYSGNDITNLNTGTLLAKAKVRNRSGELFVLESKMYSTKKKLFDTFRGTLTTDGKLSVSLRVDGLFNKQLEFDARASIQLPTLFPYERTVTQRGSRLWQNAKKSENVWLRLEVRRLKPS